MLDFVTYFILLIFIEGTESESDDKNDDDQISNQNEEEDNTDDRRLREEEMIIHLGRLEAQKEYEEKRYDEHCNCTYKRHKIH